MTDATDRPGPLVTAERGDITTVEVDVVVNAANSSLLGGGGVDGAIHRAGGPEILAACRELRATRLPDGLPAGHAVATPAGRLPARWVVHTAGPVFSREQDRSAVLRAAYAASVAEADRLGAGSVAFPAVSAGVYGWPVDDAARQAVTAVRAALPGTGLRRVRFVLFSAAVLQAFETALAG